MANSSTVFDRVEDYIWGRLDETEFLQRVVTDDHLDAEKLLAKVETIQRNLNVQLRQGVEENYPRLLEQVSAIESLDTMQSHFQLEMEAVAKQAEQLAQIFQAQTETVRTNVLAIQNLTKMNRLLSDGLKCEDLMQSWQEEGDLMRQAELVAELNAIARSNDRLRHVRWVNERCLFKLPEVSTKTRQKVLDQLRTALKSLNGPTVSACLKALQCLQEGQKEGLQKELNSLVDEAIRELDALFLQLSTQSSVERAGKLLPQLGTKLHSQLEQFQLLGVETAQQFARRVGKVIAARVPANAPYAMRLVQTVYKCLITHTDSVATVIRDSLNPLKTSILSQSLANLFQLIDEIFQQDERKDALVIEKLNAALKAELERVNWDAVLQKEMEGNVEKALKYVSVKIEQQLKLDEETLRFIGRISRAQMNNYQLLNIAHELARLWPSTGLSTSLTSVIQPTVQTILDTMKATVSLVLASMHDEQMLTPLATTASSSDYIKELCGHLKVFRTHCAQIKPLCESVEALPNFLNFAIEQFLLHISLIRPVTRDSVDRFARDLEYLCRQGLQTFNCKYAKLLNSYNQLVQFIRMIPDGFAGMEQLKQHLGDGGKLVIPQWFIVQMLICASDSELLLPHDSAGWTLAEYARWFNTHTDMERFRFLHNLLNSYKQSVVNRGGTEFVPYFPIANQIVESNLISPQF